jgi:tRNA pseudouridine55 synthase
LGEATKLCGRMLDSDKVYEFAIRFGEETDTLDVEGAVVVTSEVRPSIREVEAVLPRFTGAIEQVPPMFSALKVGGRRAYDLARAGEEVALKARGIVIHSLSVRPEPVEGQSFSSNEKSGPSTGAGRTGLDHLIFVSSVSKGTYIRSLARDIAHALGTVGHVTYLRRIKAGPFTLEPAISLDKLNEIGKGAPLEDVILPLEAGLDDIPALSLDPEAAEAVRQGRVLSGLPQGDGLYWARAGNVPVALMQLTAGTAKVVRGFNLQNRCRGV